MPLAASASRPRCIPLCEPSALLNANPGGIIYIQNARPDGPAAWLIAEVSDRLLRWVGVPAGFGWCGRRQAAEVGGSLAVGGVGDAPSQVGC